MPRAAIDLSAHRQTITWWIVQEKWPLDRVMRTLETEHNISLSANTLKRNLNAWEVSIRPRINVTPELRRRIYDLFYQERYYTDQQMAKMLRRDGFAISFRKLAKLRKEMGLSKRKDTHIPANPVLPDQVIQLQNESSGPDDDEDDDDDDSDDNNHARRNGRDVSIDPAITPNNMTDTTTTPAAPAAPAAAITQIREPSWRKKHSGNASLPTHNAPRIATTFTISRHSPPAPAATAALPSPEPLPLDHHDHDDDDGDAMVPPTTTNTEIYSQPPSNGQGLARRVTTLVTRIESLETDNLNLKQEVQQHRTENQQLRQQTQLQRSELDVMRASLNELIARFNAAHY